MAGFFGPGVSGVEYGAGAGGMSSYRIDPQYALGVAAQQAAADQLRQQLAQQERESARGDASTRYQADQNAITNRYQFGLDAETARRGQDLTFQSQQRGYDTTDRGNKLTFDAAMRGYDVADAGNRLQADTSRANTERNAAVADRGNQLQFDAATQGNQLQADTARRGQDFQLQASLAPVQFARDRFNSVLPMFQQALDNGPGELVGGQNTPTPGVTVGGVYSPQQVAEQVNAARAGNAEATATQRRLAAEAAAARGLSARSPLVAAMEGRLQAGRMAADADAERNIRFDAAGANAEQQTRGEALRGQLWAQENAMDIQRRQAAAQSRNALLAALAGFAG